MLTEKDCAVPPRFAYRHRTLHQLILKPKKVKDDEEYIFSNLLSQASGSEKDGTVPVMGRITVDGSQTQFSCKLTVDPKLWDTKGGRVTGRSTAALEANRMLDKMRVRINRHYQEIMERDNFVTAEKVKNAFLGLEHRYHTLMQVFRQHNEDYEKQVEAGMKAKGTLEKYRIVYKHLQESSTSATM